MIRLRRQSRRSNGSLPLDVPSFIPDAPVRMSEAPLRVDILIDLIRLRVGRGQRVLDAGVDLRLHVGLDALEDTAVGQALCREAPRQRLERIVLAHPLLLFLTRPVLAVDVADVMAVVAIGLALE